MDGTRAILGAAALAALAFCYTTHGRGAEGGAPGAVPVGTVMAYTGEGVPDGWLLCDGRALHRDDWPELFRAIGTSHGAGVSMLGVREADFNLPDYRGRFLRGVDAGQDGERSGSDPAAETRSAARAGTGNAGNRVGSYQPDATALPRDPMQPFRAVIDIPVAQWTSLVEGTRNGSPAAGGAAPPASERAEPVAVAGSVARRGYLVTGGDAETRPRNVSVRWIIRARP
ncbi:MAG TPA: phage tail protein [Longimicrobium sp.]